MYAYIMHIYINMHTFELYTNVQDLVRIGCFWFKFYRVLSQAKNLTPLDSPTNCTYVVDTHVLSLSLSLTFF